MRVKDTPEFVGQVIDLFEDFLAERNIKLPERAIRPPVILTKNPLLRRGLMLLQKSLRRRENVQRDPSDYPIIVGVDYDALANPLKTLIDNWGLVDEVQLHTKSGDLLDRDITTTETLDERDREFEKMWKDIANGSVTFQHPSCVEGSTDALDDVLTEDWLDFKVGTSRRELYKWFDQRHSLGVGFLLREGGERSREKEMELLHLADLSFECESEQCAYNNSGYCRFALVHEREPKLTEEDGCLEGLFDFYTT